MNRATIAACAATVVGGAMTIACASFARAELDAAWTVAFAIVMTTTAGAFLAGAVFVASSRRWALPLRRVHGAIAGAFPLAAISVLALERGRTLRVVIALAIVIALEEWLRVSALHDSKRTRAIATASIPISAFALSLVAFDVLMSVQEGWTSDIYGLYVLVASFGAGVGTIAAVAMTLRAPLGTTAEHASALGRVELVAVCVWAYVAFSLFVLVWIADLPREVTFFARRAHGAWGVVFALLAALRFGVPFVALLPKEPKRHARFVGALGAWLVAMNVVDCAWLIFPSVDARPSILAAGPTVFLAGLVALLAIARFGRHAPRPADRDLERALAYEAS